MLNTFKQINNEFMYAFMLKIYLLIKIDDFGLKSFSYTSNEIQVLQGVL